MRRLHVRIYLSLIFVSFVGLLVTTCAGRLFFVGVHRNIAFERLVKDVRGVEAELPPPGATPEQVEEMLREFDHRLELRLALYGESEALVATTAPDPPEPRWHLDEPGWLPPREGRHPLQVTLADGRRLVVWSTRMPPPPFLPLRFIGVLATLIIALLVGSWWISRRITRRLEKLRDGVQRLGAGELHTRVEIDGKDEVAAVAGSFNTAADRIERLVESQRRIMASASHELRSPLARVRVAIELMAESEADKRQALLTDASGDIEELDDLIGDLLLSSRLESSGTVDNLVETDLRELLAQETERIGAALAPGEAVTIPGDPRLLRRLVRNLLENAKRHGGGSTIDAGLEPLVEGPGARLWVADRGPGVAPEEQERIFEPFYRPADHAEGRDGGVGLGLALVRQIATHHGGEANYRDRDGGGSLFEVILAATG